MFQGSHESTVFGDPWTQHSSLDSYIVIILYRMRLILISHGPGGGGGGGGGDDICVCVLSIYVCEYVHVWVFLYGGIVSQISMCY